MIKPTLCVDVDGVLLQSPACAKWPLIAPHAALADGAADFLTRAVELFEVAIHSCRSVSDLAIGSMMEWLAATLPPAVFAQLAFPTDKPAAHMYLDDRGYRFDGTWPDPSALLAVEPWWD